MKLRRLAIDRLPGIDEPFALEDLGDGFHIIVGPNGIGKSSLCRATRALLWSEHAADEYMVVSALFDRDDERWGVERDGSRYRWQRDGVENSAPPLPVAHLDGCFFLVLRDLLDASSDAGSGLAAQIRRQMSGGFDLEQAATSVFGSAGPRHGRKERGEFDQAEINVRKSSARQAEIGRREERLADLERERVEAEAAQQRLTHFDRALEVHDLRDGLSEVETELSALPEALGRLTGAEMGQLEERERELEEKRSRRREAEAELEAALKAGAETRLEEPIDPVTLATWRQRADKLADLETRRDAAQEEWQGRTRAAAEAGRALGGGDGAAPQIDLAGSADLFAFLRDATSTENEHDAITQRLALLEGRLLSDEDRQRLDLLRTGAPALRAWLRGPDPEARRNHAVRARRSIILACVAALVGGGAVLAIATHPALWLLVGAGVGLAVALWLARPDPSAGYAREAAKREFPGGLEPPSSWTSDIVAERLREVESKLAELEAASQRARDRSVERAALESQREAAEEHQTELEQRRQELASRLGLDDVPADAELVDMARALDQLRQARQAESSAGEQVKEIAERHGALLSELSVELTSLGETDPSDAASVRAGVDHLGSRDNLLRSARTREASVRQSLRQLDDDITRVANIVSEIYRQAGLDADDRVGLARLLEGLDRHRELRGKRDGLVTSIQLAQEKLASAGELELAQHDRERLQADKERLEEQARRLAELRSQIADIRAEVRQAREGHHLENAIAERDVSLRHLEERRQEAMRAAAGRFLLDAVKCEHETNQMPRVLERARELFSTFTHHAYELRVAPDDAGSFVAIEARSGAGRRPHELSDGTRVQLLLAAHLAFADEAEQGVPLPLFLDEALDQSDPVRFQAIARSLARMVEDEGRQIFYLTNDPTDMRRIQEALAEEGCAAARTIDLAAVRNRAASIPEPEALRVEPLPRVPPPSGATPESYGAALGVPPLAPLRGHTAQHLLYLLWDDLPLLHRLLESRIEHVGPWIMLSRSGAQLATRIAAAEGVGKQLDARAQLLEAFCHAWREGRGRPVDRDAIERGGVSKHYLDDVVQIARELGGDGERLIEALRARSDERLRGFRTNAADGLEAFLIEEDYLDPRPILGESDVLGRMLATPAAAHLPEPVAAECAHRWWSLCEGSTAALT
jgi:energy-coupling factor transporter ATP-binding protein EcfA2